MNKIIIIFLIGTGVCLPVQAKYYGQYTINEFARNSVSNEFNSYGSKFSSKSINNPYGMYGNLNNTDLKPGSGNYPRAIGVKTLKLYDSDGNFRGNLNDDRYDPDSVSNPYGRYGSPYSADSISNPYGAGSKFREDSPFNKFGTGLEIWDD